MFALTPEDLKRPVVACADGPASFNAELAAAGGTVVSVDPIYVFRAQQISGRVAAAREAIVANTLENLDAYLWTEIPSVGALVATRTRAMERFLRDYEEGRGQGRYLAASLPDLPFADGQFAMALCSHFLFTYSHLLDADFHRRAIVEMRRVASEVRVFPLLEMNGARSSHVTPVVEMLAREGYDVSEVTVLYEFQRGGKTMLRIR